MSLPIINKFETFTLSELEEASLMNDREDRKYVIPIHKIDVILEDCSSVYKVLEIDNVRKFQYRTTYFDTPAFNLYHDHQHGKANRFKVRIREYLDSNLSFIEVKQSTNKGKTYKHRSLGNKLIDGEMLLKGLTPYNVDQLEEKIEILYQRITLIHKKRNEKVTIDTDMTAIRNNKKIFFSNIAFAEVKTENHQDIFFCKLMKAHKEYQGCLSKYCLGIISTEVSIKYNNFKPLNRYIQKKEHYGHSKHF
jgi:hypothetical protein